MANTVYTQVYKPDGTWYCSFYKREYAVSWVKVQPDADRWEISNRIPPKKVKSL